MSRAGRAAAGRSAALPDGPIFFDTNVIVYAYDAADAVRREQALVAVREAMRRGRLVISAQVMQEFYSVVVRQRLLQPADAIAALRLLADHTVVPANADSALRGLALPQGYQLAVWDAPVWPPGVDVGGVLSFRGYLQVGQRSA